MPNLCGVISNCFWEGAATNILEETKSVGLLSGTRLCHERKMSATTDNFFFAKKNGPKKPEMFYITFDCYHLKQAEPGPDPNTIGATRPAQALQTSITNCKNINGFS
jgi:hypothetical protein